MVYCLEATIAFATATRRNAFQTALNNAISNRPRFGNATITRTRSWGALDPQLSVTLRFTAKADADTVWDRLMTAAEQRQPRVGSTVTLHTCTHDEETNECIVYATKEW